MRPERSPSPAAQAITLPSGGPAGLRSRGLTLVGTSGGKVADGPPNRHIPNASTIERMGPERAPVGSYAPSSLAAQSFASLWAEVAAQLWA